MLANALVYLLAAVISVPIAKRLGLGAVLGYLIAGVIIGPYALKLVGDQTDVMHFAEFGVVMMLFLVGLELRPKLLWQMRSAILGLGGMQVALTAGLIYMLVAFFADFPWQTNLALGLTFALSSTAIVLQSLSEKGLLKTPAGNSAFAVLLFQDIAVIPILAMLPLLALGGHTASTHDEHAVNLIAHFPIWLQVLISSLIIIAIIVAGRFIATPIFRIIANTNLRELLTAFALLLVIAIAVLMQSIGLSPALGTFLAGVVLAESEFRHQLEADIDPFKSLLLGLFFITVGASIDFDLLINQPILIGSIVFALVFSKAIVLFSLSRLFSMSYQQGLLFTFALAQGGEFAFVLVSAASQFQVFNSETANLVTVVVALSMLISPLLIVLYEYLMSKPNQQSSEQADSFHESSDVIIAGYGRFGQVVGRLLKAQGYRVTILDHSASQVELVRRFGGIIYYGDASRADLLAAAGAAEAKLLVVAVDDAEKSLEIIDTTREHFPNLKILTRAVDRRHAYDLIRKDVQGFERETFHSALKLGIKSLQLLGLNRPRAEKAGALFADHDEQLLIDLSELWGDERRYGQAARQAVEDLSQVLQNEQNAANDQVDTKRASRRSSGRHE